MCNASNRKLNPLDACYEFVDAMFSREIFTKLSWAGGSKSDVPKSAFKNFKRTIHLFILLVREIFADFSETSCFDFFKNKVIANSTARANASQKRVSRTKHRMKNHEKENRFLLENSIHSSYINADNKRDSEEEILKVFNQLYFIYNI